MKPIIAGIINRHTGEITDTTTLTREKKGIRLKVRDELKCRVGEGDYMGFEFGLTTSLDFYRRYMVNKDPIVFFPLRILFSKFRIYENEQKVESAQKYYDMASEVLSDMQKKYADEPAKKEFLEDCLDEGVEDARKLLESCKSSLSNSKRFLAQVEKEQAEAIANRKKAELIPPVVEFVTKEIEGMEQFYIDHILRCLRFDEVQGKEPKDCTKYHIDIIIRCLEELVADTGSETVKQHLTSIAQLTTEEG